MSKKRAFVRYTKSGEIVPGSLIITTNGGYPDKSSIWKEIQTNECCNPTSDCPVGPFTFTLFEVPEDFGSGSYIRLFFTCYSGEEVPGLEKPGTSGYAFGELLSPTTSPTISEVVDLINTTFSGQGITAQLVEGVLQVTVSNTNYISSSCPGSDLSLFISFSYPA